MKTHTINRSEGAEGTDWQKAGAVQLAPSPAGPTAKMADTRACASSLEHHQRMANGSPQAMQLKERTELMALSTSAASLRAAQLNMKEPAQQRAEKSNSTGLPDQLKAGIESLSGMGMDHVKVHYNSDKPAQLQAHAYAQGSQIHIGPGQEKHLPHEAWHVVQQAQGRVRPTLQMKGGVAVNDDLGLEREADLMGERALGFAPLVQRQDGGMVGMTAVSPINRGDSAGTVVQPVLKIKRSPNSPFTELKYIHYRALTKKRAVEPDVVSGEATAQSRYELSDSAWLILKRMASSKGIWEYEKWKDAIDQAEQIARAENVDDAFNYYDSKVAEVEPALHGKLIGLQLPEFENFDLTQIWRLMLDGKKQAKRGKYGFENEKGYMSALMTAFTHMLGTLNQTLTTAAYEQLHDLAVRGVLDRSGEKMRERFRDSYLYGEAFGVDDTTKTGAGLQELIAKYKARNDGENSSDVGGVLAENPETMFSDEGPQILKLKPLVRSQCVRFADNVLTLYGEEIAAAENEDDKLSAIVKCCQDLDQLHLFVDGNIRTIAFLVLNKLLLENNLDPVILNEPNVFDCNSVQELVAAVRAGQVEFNKYKV